MKKITIIAALFLLAVYSLKAQSTEGEFDKENKVDGPSITQSEAILTAHEFTRIHWDMTEKNQSSISCNDNYKSMYPIGHRVGMGYMWGGWDDVETFLKKVAEGYGTGTGGFVHYEDEDPSNERDDDYSRECVTGTSCTGLVSRAWNLNRKYTLNYPQYPEVLEQFHRITYDIEGVDFLAHKTDMLQKGDAFINKRHIILFVYETRDKTAMVIDSRLFGVSFREASWKELADGGYKAIRYNNIKEVINPQGTMNNPILINADKLPFSDENNTRDLVSMEFDRYSVASVFNEQGPEVIYKLQVNSKKTFGIYLESEVLNEGIDNDIYLLKSLKRENKYFAENSIDRGNNLIIEELEPGEYYIIVDSGKDQPGEYKLVVEELDR